MTKGELAEFARAVAREVVAELQRSGIETQTESVISVGLLVVNVAAHTAHVHGKRLKIKPREFSVLAALAIHAGNVLSREQLLQLAWPHPEEIDGVKTVDVHICRLRSKLRSALGTRAECIESIHDVGYVLRPAMLEAIA
jgi:DNA-binding response OmpR family regulator